MLVYLEIENFQMHKKLHLDFVAGVNVLQGESDVGKSCVIRALLWVMTNRPAGFTFRHWDCKKNDQVKVTLGLQVENKIYKIVRVRSETVNEYWLDDQVFKAMGASVPEPILQVLNMRDFNMQTQHLPHFLLSVSAGEVAKSLNAACDLSVIDKTIKTISSIASKAKTDCKYAQKEAEDINQKLDELDWLVDAKKQASILANEIKSNEKRRQDFEVLSELANKIKIFENDLKSKQYFLEYWKDLEQVSDLLARISKTEVKLNALRTTVNKALLVKKQLQQHIKAQIPSDKLKQSAEIIKVINQSQEQVTKLSEIVLRLENIYVDLKDAKVHHKKAKQELNELWETLDYCPLCNQAKK